MSVASRKAGFAGKIALAVGIVALSAANVCAVTLKPKIFPVKVLGIQVDVPITIAFDMKTEGDAVALQLGTEGRLKGVQDNALQIARALPVPRGNCDRLGINPVVNSIDEASIAADGDTAVVAIKGHMTAWLCAKPVGMTVKTEGPRDSVSITATVRVAVIDGKQLGLELVGPVTVKAGSALTQEAIRLFAGDINASVANALGNALSAEEARAKLPSLPGLDGSITGASFASDGGALLIRAHGNACMTSETFNSLLDMMNK